MSPVRIRTYCQIGFLLLATARFAPGAWALTTLTPPAVQAPVKIWVNTASGVYHCPGSRWYGTTKAGSYLNEPAARARGYRPAYGRACGPLANSDNEISPALKTVVPVPTTGVKVWVNTNSNVYHCPGTRYYGNTVKGRYMIETEAKVAGNRPAYGRACS